MKMLNIERATVEQALEALEYAQQDRECPSTTRQAITALRAALAKSERKRRTVKKRLTDDGWKKNREICS